MGDILSGATKNRRDFNCKKMIYTQCIYIYIDLYILLSEMKLLAGRRCQRPVSMTATIDLKDEKVEVPAVTNVEAATCGDASTLCM